MKLCLSECYQVACGVSAWAMGGLEKAMIFQQRAGESEGRCQVSLVGALLLVV